MSAFATASKSIFGWVSAAVAVALIAVSASILAAPGKAYADTASHIEATGEIHVLVDGAGNAAIPNVTLRNTGSVAAYVTGCSAPDELSGWTCDAVGKRIEPGQSVQASWSGQVSADTAAKLGSEAYFAGKLTYSYVDAELKATVAIDNQDPCVGDTVTASVSGLNISDDQVTYQWYRVKDGVETAIDGAVQPAYTVVDADADCTLLCKLFSSDSICIGSVSSDATHEVKRAVEAFAVYSADNGSLNFYKRSSVPAAGEQFEGKTATAVYTGIETDSYNSSWNLPWKSYVSKIKTATVVDDGLRPFNMSCWFNSCESMTACDLDKLDTSNVTSMSYMFYGCSNLTSVGDLSSWDTSKVTNMGSWFNGCTSLTSVGDLSSWDTSKVTNMYDMFEGCRSLTSVGDLSNWNTSNVTGMYGMFNGCSNLTSVGDLSSWDTTNVTNMYDMFKGCSSLTSLGDLSSWDTSKVTNMYDMFRDCSSITTLGDLYSWDTSKVTNMYWMFGGCSSLTSLGDLSSWNTSKVINMSGMFYGCSSITSLDLSSWSTNAASSMIGMFDNCSGLQKVTFGENWRWVGTNGYLPVPSDSYITGADGKWYDTDGNGYAPKNIPSYKAMTYTAVAPKIAFAVYSADDDSLNFYKRSSVPSAGEQFNGKTATAVYTGIENKAYSPWWSSYTSKIKAATVVDDGLQPFNMRSWFYGCKSMTACNLDKLDTSNVTDMGFLFNGCSSLTSLDDLSGWNTGNVTNMKYMFNGCSSLTTTDLSGWNTSNVADMEFMFVGCKSLTSLGDLSGWDTGNVTNMDSMFSSCSSLTTLGDLSNWDTSNVTDMQAAFAGCKSLTTLDLSNWNTSNVTDMSFMFSGCSKLTSTDLSGWNTSNVADMESMFRSCSILVSVNGPSYWNTSNVADMEYMFYDCPKLTTIGDLSGWDTGNVTNMDSMFYRGSSLTTLGDLSNWNTSKVTNMLSMFASCSSLTTIGDLSNWDTSNVTNMNSMFTFCSNLTSLDLSGWDTSKAEIMTGMFNGCSSLTSLGDLSNWNTGNVTYMNSMFGDCSELSVNCSKWDVSKVTGHSNFNKNATGVTVPLAWQASSDEDGEDSAIAPLCEEQGNGKALSVPSKNSNDEAASKTDDEASADSETEGNATTSADDVGAKEEEASDGIEQEEPIAA